MSQVSLVPIMAWIVALACWGSAVWQGTRRGKRQGMQPVLWDFAVDRALRYLFIFPLGLVSLWAFVGHVFFPERAAAAIGWQGSPFQFEVGVANLGIGLAALYAAFAPFTARIAVAIVAACFLIGAGIGHVHGILTDGNVAPGNAGPILIADFLTPLSILVLLGCALWRPRPKSRDSLQLEAEFVEARRAMRSYRQALDAFVKD